MRILIIEDEESIRKTTSVALEAMGHEPIGVETGLTALGFMEKQKS